MWYQIKDANFSVNHAGIIPALWDETEKIWYFAFGISETGQALDFGGRPEAGETWVETAIREAGEESLIFTFTLNPSDWVNITSINGKNVALVIKEIDSCQTREALSELFQEQRQKLLLTEPSTSPFLEMTEMIWLSELEIRGSGILNLDLRQFLLDNLPLSEWIS